MHISHQYYKSNCIKQIPYLTHLPQTLVSAKPQPNQINQSPSRYNSIPHSRLTPNPKLTIPSKFAQELLSTFSTDLGEVALVPATGGIFTVSIYHSSSEEVETQETILWDRKTNGGFPGTYLVQSSFLGSFCLVWVLVVLFVLVLALVRKGGDADIVQR